MSARKLCSHIVKLSNSSFLLRRQLYTKSKFFTHQTEKRVSHTANYSQALGSLTKDQAHDLVYRMNDEERVILLRTLEQFNVSVEKGHLECKYDRECCLNQPDECLHLTRRISSRLSLLPKKLKWKKNLPNEGTKHRTFSCTKWKSKKTLECVNNKLKIRRLPDESNFNTFMCRFLPLPTCLSMSSLNLMSPPSRHATQILLFFGGLCERN